MKPADIVPASAWRLAEIIKEAGAPDGVFNLVMGKGSVVGEAIITHRGIDAISFTGSQSVGRARRRGLRQDASAASSSRWAARTRWWCWTTPTSTWRWRAR